MGLTNPTPRPNPTHAQARPTMTTNISKKRKFVADGVFYAELNEVRACALLSTCLPACFP